MCIEHCGGCWQVKLLAWKGNPVNMKAYCAGNCALETCASSEWSVFDGRVCLPAPEASIAFGADAEMHWARIASSPDYVLLPAFSQGCKVFIQGLVSKPELNGCRGKLVGCFSVDTQRWPVRVTPKSGAHEELLLKEANLVQASAVVAAAAAATTTTTATSAATTSRSGAAERMPDLTRHGDDAPPPQSPGLFLQTCSDPACGRQLRESKKVSGLCRSCRTVRYCSAACQESHWPEHRDACKRSAALSQAVARNPAHAMQLKKQIVDSIPSGRPIPRGSTIMLTG